MSKIINSANFVDHYAYPDTIECYVLKGIGERPSKPSLTQPGQNMTVKELLKRHVRGQSVQVFEPVYSDDPFFAEVDRMDIFERIDESRRIGQEVSKTRAGKAKEVAEVIKPGAFDAPESEPKVED